MKFQLPLFLVLYLATSAVCADDLPMHDCDKLAASDSDPERKGRGVPFEQIDAVEAIKACVDAVAQYPGSVRFKFQLARAHDAARDFNSALKYYKIAAEHGYSPAQYNLGNILIGGVGIQKDYVTGFEWVRKSAEQGNPSAQVYLGYLYLNGEGVAKDVKAAVEWYRKAADQGNLPAIETLKRLPEACPSQQNTRPPSIEVADLFIDLSEHVDKQVIIEEAEISAAGNNGAQLRNGNLNFIIDGSSMDKETYRYFLRNCSDFISSDHCKVSMKVIPTGETQAGTGYPILGCAALIK